MAPCGGLITLKLVAWLLFVGALHIPAVSSYRVATASVCPAEIQCSDGSTCCQDPGVISAEYGKCVNLGIDHDFCGICSDRCSQYQHCCGGTCISIFDHENCGMCGNKCFEYEFCLNTPNERIEEFLPACRRRMKYASNCVTTCV